MEGRKLKVHDVFVIVDAPVVVLGCIFENRRGGNFRRLVKTKKGNLEFHEVKDKNTLNFMRQELKTSTVAVLNLTNPLNCNQKLF